MKYASSEWAIVGTIDPQTGNGGEYLSDEVDMSKFHEVMALVVIGDIGSSGTVDGSLQAASTSGGSYSAITGKSITQLTASGSDDNKQVVINCRGDETGGKRYVKLGITCSAHNSLICGVILARGRIQPSSDDDLASVDEILT
jgi:hypothetical protein